MVINAVILRITAPVVDAGGGITFTPAVGTLGSGGLPCSVAGPTRRQQIQLGHVIKDAKAVCRVEDAVLAGTVVREGYQVQLQVDGRDAVTYRVLHVGDSELLGISHKALFLGDAGGDQ